ncbi:Uncharacterised protein [Legionella beliardensis]|uniref:Uncharacterized protein n=1 Tax=Legionella beliardensis TaxID=91822 RepID=A0A378I1M3_9GAMM|nr:Uncharacterised protein [Legionella beliardensis]
MPVISIFIEIQSISGIGSCNKSSEFVDNLYPSATVTVLR